MDLAVVSKLLTTTRSVRARLDLARPVPPELIEECLALTYEEEVATLLGIPDTVTAAAVLPVAYFKGDDFKPARRVPARERTHWDTWGAPRERR